MHGILIALCCMVSGTVHSPSGAPIANAQVVFSGPASASATTDVKGGFSVQVAPGRYSIGANARGFIAITADIGSIDRDSTVDVALEPADSPKLRTIGEVRVNGGYGLVRSAIPEMSVSRAQMDALGYSTVLQGLQQIPSVVIQHPDSGAPTAPAVVSLRGPDPSESLVTLDGQVLNDG
ncbi:MAG TPA: carboxypeptidase regulatory-like domain-containing protein, partial [Candidatus Tumulicola sp.]